jgi:hypothetical protein
MELTNEQIERQDFVDNRIFELIQEINPSQTEIDWDIEVIANVRETIRIWLVEELKLTDEMTFYAYLEELMNGN